MTLEAESIKPSISASVQVDETGSIQVTYILRQEKIQRSDVIVCPNLKHNFIFHDVVLPCLFVG